MYWRSGKQEIFTKKAEMLSLDCLLPSGSLFCLTQKGELGISNMQKHKNSKSKLSNAELATILGLIILVLVGFAMVLKIETSEVWYFFGASIVALFRYLLSVHHKN